MARNMKTSHQLIISIATKEKTDTEENTTHLYPIKDLDTKHTKIRSKVSKFNTRLTNSTKHNTSPSLRCSRKNRMTTKLYDANHLYMMTIAHTRRNKKSNTTPRSIHLQQRRHILNREVSSKFRR